MIVYILAICLFLVGLYGILVKRNLIKIVIGFMIMLKIYVLGGLFFILMAVIYYRTIKKEELMLEERFKQAYNNYKRKVPAIFPTVFPYTQGEKWPFSFKRLLRSKEHKLFLWMIVVSIAFHLKHEFMIERESMDANILRLMIIAVVLGMIDLFGELIKWKRVRVKNLKQSG